MSMIRQNNPTKAMSSKREKSHRVTEPCSTLLTKRNQRTFGVIVSVRARPDNPRHFGLSSRQRTSRTRGVVTRCRKVDLTGILSGSGECGAARRRLRSTDRWDVQAFPCYHRPRCCVVSPSPQIVTYVAPSLQIPLHRRRPMPQAPLVESPRPLAVEL